MKVAWLIVLVAGCGRVGFDGLTSVLGDDAPIDGSVGDGSSDGATTDGPTMKPFGQCVPGTTILDNFDDGTPAPNFTSNSSAQIVGSESGGLARITFGTTVTGGASAFFYSNAEYATDGLCIDLEVTQIPSNGGGMYLKFSGIVQEIGFITAGESLSAFYDDGNGSQQAGFGFGILPANKFWRLDVRNQNVRLFTSADAVTWTLRNTMNGMFTENPTHVTFGAGATAGDISNGGVALFERIAIGHD